MKFEPHNYQRYAVEFIKTRPVAAIMLAMGLGKTVITLSAINDLLYDSFEVSKVLIIAPLRVARDTWSDEIKKWEHLKNIRYQVAVGSEEERLHALRQDADVYIINRENIQWLIEKSNIEFKFDMIVIDELSSFKNGKSKRFQSLIKVRPMVKRVIGLTGTPASNGLMDLWAEFKILDLGKRLGRFITHYRNTYFMPDRRNREIIYSYKPLPNAEKEIYKQIEDISISMTAKDYLKMPKLLSNEYKVKLSSDELKKYKQLEEEYILEMDDDITASNAAALTGKLLQVANGAIYSDEKNVVRIHDRKLDALEDIVESANGNPILVAYWFKHDLTRIEERLKALKVNFAKIDTTENIKRWNNKELQVGLIHPASAGHGLNLQSGGSTIVWFGLTWSLELYEQTNARLYRQGQSSDTVVIIHIITDETLDSDVMKALQKKTNIQNSLIKALKARVGGRKNEQS